MEAEKKKAEKSWVVEKIVDKRIIDNVVNYRIKWEGYASKHNTWESESNLSSAMGAVAKYEKGIKRRKINKAK